MQIIKLISILLILCSLNTHGQNVSGTYKDAYGYQLELKSDSTFFSSIGIDVVFFWQTGVWQQKGDIIYLTPVTINDTLFCDYKLEIILSKDTIAERLTCEEANMLLFYSGVQKDSLAPPILVIKNNRLYPIKNNGSLKKLYKMKSILISIRNNNPAKPPIVLFTRTIWYDIYFSQKVHLNKAGVYHIFKN